MQVQKSKILFKISVIFLLISSAYCTDEENAAANYDKSASYNIYKNNIELQKINNYRQQKETNILIKYFDSDNSLILRETILSLAPISDSNSLAMVIPFLNNNDPYVRIAAAFTIGQSYCNIYEQHLIDAFNNESDDYVKKNILIAIAKCASEKGAKFIVSKNFEEQNDILLEAQGKAFYHLANKGLISKQMLEKIFKILDNPNVSQNSKLAYSYIFTVKKLPDLSSNFEIIKKEIKTNSNVYLLTNLIKSLKYVKTLESLQLLKDILETNADYRNKIAAINSLSEFNYNSVKETLFTALLSKNTEIAETSAKYFLLNGIRQDANKYFNISKEIISWQARTIMLSAALRYTNNKTIIANSIISGYNAVENKYEKAALLYALSEDPSQYKFVKEQTFSSDNSIINTAGIKSLYAMRLNKNFNKIAKRKKQINGIDLKTEFKIIFKEAMTSGNISMIYYAAKLMNKPGIEMIDINTNIYFLTQALNTLTLPSDFFAYNELCKTLKIYGGPPCKNPKIKATEIQWDSLTQIQPEQRVVVKTTKGEFEITLEVNKAPIAVGTFIKLVKNNYYNNTYFYENIAGKAIITGGKKGNGRMTYNLSLINEIKPVDIKEGMVAMRLLNGEYQSINWFVTKAPVISYEHKYTIFGQVSKGLQVIHNLEVGDKIIDIILI